MGTKLNRSLYIVELIMLLTLSTLAYIVTGSSLMVTGILFVFTWTVNILLFKKEVKNVVPHGVFIFMLLLNGAGIWFQYTLYGVFKDELYMSYYLLMDVLTAFAMIFVVYMSITVYIRKGISEMSFGAIEYFDEYMKDFRLLIACYLMVTLLTSFNLVFAYNDIRGYLLSYAPQTDSTSLKYIQYLVFCLVPMLVAVGLNQLPKDLRKEVAKKIDEQFKEK